DGRWIWFQSTATNIVDGVTNAGELYVRDLNADKTYWASRDAGRNISALLPYRLTNCVYAPNGSASCFAIAVRDPALGEVIRWFYFDPSQQLLSAIPANVIGEPILTDDGRRVLYGAKHGIYTWDAMA